MKQLQDTAEAAISAVDNRKRKAEDIDRLAPAPAPLKRKKKPSKEDCERKLKELREENETLRRHLEMVKNKTAQFERERKAQEQKMKQLVMLSTKGNHVQYHRELRMSLKQFTETYSDYGKHRREELFFHLNQLEKNAAPTTFTKMSLWTLGQNEQFFTQPKHHPISGILRKELDITPAQGRKILAQRFKIQRLCQNIKEVLQLIADLKALCQKKQKVFSDRMSKCQEILTPEQVTKLLVWIDDNSSVLESVCPGWGSERIRGQEQGAKGSPARKASATATGGATANSQSPEEAQSPSQPQTQTHVQIQPAPVPTPQVQVPVQVPAAPVPTQAQPKAPVHLQQPPVQAQPQVAAPAQSQAPVQIRVPTTAPAPVPTLDPAKTQQTTPAQTPIQPMVNGKENAS